jgi:hypothetical protein
LPAIVPNDYQEPENKQEISHTRGLRYVTTRIAAAAIFAFLVERCPAG